MAFRLMQSVPDSQLIPPIIGNGVISPTQVSPAIQRRIDLLGRFSFPSPIQRGYETERSEKVDDLNPFGDKPTSLIFVGY
jgi:hypothetical protein